MVDRKRINARVRLITFKIDFFHVVEDGQKIELTFDNWDRYKQSFVKRRREAYDIKLSTGNLLEMEKKALESKKRELEDYFDLLNYSETQRSGLTKEFQLLEMLYLDFLKDSPVKFKQKYLAVTTLFAQGIIGKHPKEKGGKYFYKDEDGEKLFSTQAGLRNSFMDEEFVNAYGNLQSCFNESLNNSQTKNDLFNSPSMLKVTHAYCVANKLKMTNRFLDACDRLEIVV